jgi:hypothetical protein
MAKFSSLPHGFELLKGNIHDQNEPEPLDNSELTMLGANETTFDFDFYIKSHVTMGCIVKLTNII